MDPREYDTKLLIPIFASSLVQKINPILTMENHLSNFKTVLSWWIFLPPYVCLTCWFSDQRQPPKQHSQVTCCLWRHQTYSYVAPSYQPWCCLKVEIRFNSWWGSFIGKMVGKFVGMGGPLKKSTPYIPFIVGIYWVFSGYNPYDSCIPLPSLKLTFCPWKWMVGILSRFPFGKAYFQVQNRHVSFRGCICKGVIPPNSCQILLQQAAQRINHSHPNMLPAVCQPFFWKGMSDKSSPPTIFSGE